MKEMTKSRLFALAVVIVFFGSAYLMNKTVKTEEKANYLRYRYHIN